MSSLYVLFAALPWAAICQDCDLVGECDVSGQSVNFLQTGMMHKEQAGSIHFGFLCLGDLSYVKSAVQITSHLAKHTNRSLTVHMMFDMDGVAEVASSDKWSLALHDLRSISVEQSAVYRALAGKVKSSTGKMFMYKAIAHTIVKSCDRLILLDTDVQLLHPKYFGVLWNLFDKFSDSEMIGMVAEQQATYYSCQSGRQGVNGGVQLLDLAKMRGNSAYNQIVSAESYPAWFEASKHKCPRQNWRWGDQDFHTLLGEFHPDWYHTVPCEWNFQLQSEANMGCKACPIILHGNAKRYKPFFKDTTLTCDEVSKLPAPSPFTIAAILQGEAQKHHLAKCMCKDVKSLSLLTSALE